MMASHDQAMTMMTALAMVPAIRPGFRLRSVWLRNICSWARQSSRPTSSPAMARPTGLLFEATQDGAYVLLAAPGQLQKDLLQRLPVLAHYVAQLLQAAHGDQAAAIDDGEPRAHSLRDLQDMGGEEHRLALLAEVLEDVLHLAGALRIEADGGLIEEEHLRVVEQGRGE